MFVFLPGSTTGTMEICRAHHQLMCYGRVLNAGAVGEGAQLSAVARSTRLRRGSRGSNFEHKDASELANMSSKCTMPMFY